MTLSTCPLLAAALRHIISRAQNVPRMHNTASDSCPWRKSNVRATCPMSTPSSSRCSCKILEHILQLFFAYPGLFNLRENPFAATHSAAQFCPFTNLYFTNSTVNFVNTCPLGASPWMISACDSLEKLRVHGVKHRGVPCCSSRITTMRSFRCFRSLFFSLSSEFQYMAFHVLSSSPSRKPSLSPRQPKTRERTYNNPTAKLMRRMTDASKSLSLDDSCYSTQQLATQPTSHLHAPTSAQPNAYAPAPSTPTNYTARPAKVEVVLTNGTLRLPDA